jgi:hypothetical protein
MTKQSGFSVILGSLTFYNNRAQTNVGRYLAPLGVTLIVLILWFEAKNGGNFIRSIAWYPAFSLAGPSQLDWNHLAGLWSAFYFGKYFWILPLLGFSLVSAIRRKSIALLSLYVTYAADLAFNLHAGQHLGAGGPYLWFNWHLTSILVAIGLGELVFILFISFKNRFPVRALMTPFVIVFFLLITKNNLVPLLNEPPEKLVGMAIKAGRAQDEVIAKMVGQSTEASWASVRSPTSILKNGFVLDREFCSLNGSLSLAGSKNSATQTIISDLRTGKYNYFQTGFPYSCGSIPGVEEALRDCWTFIAYGNVTFYGIQLQTEILKYKGYCTQSAGDST